MSKAPSGVRADFGYSYRDLERIAAYVREQLSLSPTKPVDALRLFDGLEISVRDGMGRDIPVRGNVIELDESEGFAKYDSERRVIEILASTETYDWLEHDYPRGRFFVAHEWGHCLLHTDQLVRIAKLPKDRQAALHHGNEGDEHPIFRDTEWQANAFASAFLMPARGIYALEQDLGDTIDPIEIAEHFGASLEAASYRFEQYTNRKVELL